MKIKTILSQHRRDFTATLECEHCNSCQKLNGGYDDSFFHEKVIPNIRCEKCDKKAPNDYLPITTKYGPEEVI